MRLRPKTKFYEIGNPEFYLLRTLGKLAMEKAIQVDQVIATPKAERLVNKIAKFLLLAAAAIFGIPILFQILKGLK